MLYTEWDTMTNFIPIHLKTLRNSQKYKFYFKTPLRRNRKPKQCIFINKN